MLSKVKDDSVKNCINEKNKTFKRHANNEEYKTNIFKNKISRQNAFENNLSFLSG